MRKLVVSFILTGVDLNFAAGTNAVKAAQAVTQQTPIVFTTVDDPLAFGLVKSYAQPGGNITGVGRSRSSARGETPRFNVATREPTTTRRRRKVRWHLRQNEHKK